MEDEPGPRTEDAAMLAWRLDLMANCVSKSSGSLELHACSHDDLTIRIGLKLEVLS